MTHVFWQKSFKSMEADYSNHLASHKGHYWRTTRDATVTAFTDAFIDAFKGAIIQILHIVTSHVSTQ